MFAHAKSVAKDTHHKVGRNSRIRTAKRPSLHLEPFWKIRLTALPWTICLNTANDVIANANNDPEFYNWGKGVTLFVRKCLKEDSCILNHQSTESDCRSGSVFSQ